MATYEHTHKIIKLGQSKGIVLKKKKSAHLNVGDQIVVTITKVKVKTYDEKRNDDVHTIEPTPIQTHTEATHDEHEIHSPGNAVEPERQSDTVLPF